MNVTRADFTCYRNLESVSVPFCSGVNVLWGRNAQGKSNILEGIYYFARGRSFRGARDRELIMFGAQCARSEIEFLRSGSDTPCALSAAIPNSGKKELCRNGARLRGSAEMLGAFRAVLFCPSHLSIVVGGPAERRAFLDIAIAQNSFSYIYYLSNYRRIIAERNALLKRAASGLSVSTEEWETYAEQLCLAASEIYAERSRYCDELTHDVADCFSEMTGGVEVPSLRYVSKFGSVSADDTDPGVPYESREVMAKLLFAKLTENIDRETAVGTTLWGPHKDDIHITINGRDARLFASQGQQRSIALAMKLAEGEISRRTSGEYPVFLLDDVFSELDSVRRSFIMEKLSGRQIIVTSCEPSVIPDDEGSGEVRYIEVSGGRILGGGDPIA